MIMAAKIIVIDGYKLFLGEGNTKIYATLQEVLSFPWSDELKTNVGTLYEGADFHGYSAEDLRIERNDRNRQTTVPPPMGPRERLFEHAMVFNGSTKRVGDAIRFVAENGFSTDVDQLIKLLKL